MPESFNLEVEPIRIDRNSVIIDRNLLESLSFGLYTQPIEVYRELVQNAADAYQEANTPAGQRRVDISVDRLKRTVSVRDYALGLDEVQFVSRLISLGFSHKSNQNLRGFRGVGRLSALGYCKFLVFRSRQAEREPILEMRWDVASLRNLSEHQDLVDSLVGNASFSRLSSSEDWPPCFFECSLEGVVYCKNDSLVNPKLISDYLSERGPVPFRDDFGFYPEIKSFLGEDLLFDINIYINNNSEQVHRPHRDSIFHASDNSVLTTFNSIERIAELDDYFDTENKPVARGWVLHHEYPGALPVSSLVRGLRVRIGNIQIGDEHIFDNLFKESRFNVWCVGEIHICNSRIRPNTRRDNLEQSYDLDGLVNAIGVLTHRLTKICRESSRKRYADRRVKHYNLKLRPVQYKKLLSKFKLQEPLPEKITFSMQKEINNNADS